MRVLVLGGQGMLGHKLYETLQARCEMYATFRTSDGPWRAFPMYTGGDRTLPNVDALQFDTVVDAVARLRPQVIVNCVGIIKQLDSQTSVADMIAINALFPHRLYSLCRAADVRLVQLSTDCVFSGERGNYTEDDEPDPVDTYGRTKLLGEVNGDGALTIRTSIIGRDYVKDAGLLEWFLGNRGGRVSGYARAIYSGFTTAALSRIIGDLITDYPDLSGVYHVASKPISKLALLQQIRDAANLDIEIVPDESFTCDRSLNPARFLKKTAYALPGWEQMIAELTDELSHYDQWRDDNAASG